MAYFLTGATGFIGSFFIPKLLARNETLYCLVRKESLHKLDALRERYDCDDTQLVAVTGDLQEKNLGIADKIVKELSGNISHFYHLAAVYDLKADEMSQMLNNIEGTRNAIDAAESIKAGGFHHISSIAAAGLYKGTFKEDMFSEATDLDDPYLKTKHESEKLVREQCKIPYTVYRPGMVIGHSETGEIDKIDGPYYFFKFLQRVRNALPPWVPLAGIQGGKLNIVPVDYVVDALDHISHLDKRESDCYHLTSPKSIKMGEALNIFAHAGHAPAMTMRIDTRMFSFMPPFLRQAITALPPVKRFTNLILDDLGIPRSTMKFLNYPTSFDNHETKKALKGTDISCPKLQDYAPAIWDYWERNLDPDLHIDRSLEGSVGGKTVVVTGATSGIGKAAAMKLASTGAKIILVARTVEKLEETKQEIEAKGGEAWLYSCDISDMASCDQLVKDVLKDHGHIDVLVNNAGRSIRRSVSNSYDRFHDFERTMQLNYFGCLRLIMGFLPVMEQRRGGQIINISSIGVLTNAPRFSAYVASKSALDAFTRCAAAEFSDLNIHWTTINMPLVRTPMIAPTKIYDHVPAITPEEAADMIAEAMIFKPKRIATRLGIFAAVLYSIAPKLSEVVMNSGFKMFPDSAASQNKEQDGAAPTNELVAFSHIMRGIHW